jgi:hypothetical protein
MSERTLSPDRLPSTVPADTTDVSESRVAPEVIAAIEAAISSIRYGVVQVVIQDGRVVQIERTEKIRFR